jgi:Fe-S-cluster containining protein
MGAMEQRSSRSFEAFLALLDPGEKADALGSLARKIQELRSRPRGAERARWVHDLAEEAMARFREHRPELVAQVRCGRGCAHCCHLWVGVTRDEAALLAERVEAGTARPDPGRMEVQRHWDTPMAFLGRPASETACVFLGPDSACTVYEDRPSICRALLVTSDPEGCRAGGEESRTTSIMNPPLDLLLSAALTVDTEDDQPPPYGRPLAATLYAALHRATPAE